MNKRLHRVVFNAARGLRMVVHQGARSAGKATGTISGVLDVTIAAVLALTPAQAQIAGDRTAPGHLRPTVLVAPNGVPLINIQTPSAAGVSRNHFSQFDVPASGAILNNSGTAVQTQLGGWVQGNPWPANGSARLILNEITGGSPTQIRGFIEVGGQKAEVVIANPAGISVDGGGFINASRATLTTGTPQLNAMGGLDSYVVRGGTVTYVKEHGFADDERDHETAPYHLTVNTTVTLAAARQEGHTAFGGSGTTIGNGTQGQAGEPAQGPGAVRAGTSVSPIVQVPAAVGGSVKTTGTTLDAGPPASSLVVRTSTPNAALPTASLFATHPEPTSRYLVETDPRFALWRQWLSSDYLLNNLGLDPNLTQKRLGDGFYEQRLVREQVAQLTGHRYLDGYDSDDDQYIALMNAGATFARQYGLRPGIALTAAQMAQLTSDIVWLVEQTVTLEDDTTQQVLVPQLYVRVKPGDIDGSGALLSGDSVNLQLAGDLDNGGTIAGRRVTAITAENARNLGGRITGDAVAVLARNDLDVIGGTIDAASSLSAIAGQDLNVVTTTTTRSASNGPGSAALDAVVIDRVAGLYVTNPNGTLLALAGRDANLQGAELRSAGDIEVLAGRDLNLDTVATGRHEDIRWSEKNTRQTQSIRETGTTIAGAGDVTLHAGRDLTGRGCRSKRRRHPEPPGRAPPRPRPRREPGASQDRSQQPQRPEPQQHGCAQRKKHPCAHHPHCRQ